MSILLLSDIHANFVALQAVLEQAGSVDALWCLGDTVGYGPQPNECVAAMRDQDSLMLVGNHDLGVLDSISLVPFNREARIANEWNGDQLEDDHRQYLLDLQPMQSASEQVLLAHGSPRDPVWEYILNDDIAAAVFRAFNEQVCFVGHTHQPAIYILQEDGTVAYRRPTDSTILDLEPGKRYILNPGSVGQPRDGDARAAWALYDPAEKKVYFRRTTYNIRKVQQLMLEYKLPEMLAARLSFGL